MVIRQIPYRQFDHTGDLGLEVEGTTLRVLFENAGRALFDLLCDLERVRSREEIGILVEGVDRADLLVRFLSEALYLFDVGGFQFCRFSFPLLEDRKLRAVGSGEIFREERHRALTSIKAITHHQARVERSPEGLWEARLILDI